MANDDDPVAAAQEAAEAMRALALATRRFADPADASWAMGDVLAIASRFIQVLEQVAQAHRDQLAFAHDDTGRRTAGRAFGLSAAVDLHQAAIAHAEVFRRLDRAAQSSGRIAWYSDDPAHRVPVSLAAGHTVEAVTTPRRSLQRVSEPGL